MRKLWIMPVVAALLLLAAGCSVPKVSVPDSADHVGLSRERDEVLSGTTGQGEVQWNYRITTYTVTGEHCAQDDPRHVLTRHSYQLAAMEVLPAGDSREVPAEAIAAAAAFNGTFEQVLREETAWLEEMAADADADYSAVGHEADSLWQQEGFHYSDEAVLSFWSNDHLLCITTDRCSYSGGTHPTAWRSCVSFDVSTGKAVSLTEMTDDMAQLQETVARELLRQAAERQRGTSGIDPIAYYDDYTETLEAWTERSVCFDDQGMTVIFGVYDIAPYAAGEQHFLIPYELLLPCLSSYGKTMLELH